MREGTVNVINPLGLHARAAAQLVRVAVGFKSEIILKRVDNRTVADAKSMLSVLTLAASIRTVLELNVVGEDEEPAFNAITKLFDNGFGEL